jgi:hypothetical protein
MNDHLNDNLSEAHAIFKQGHDALRAALLASLPDQSSQAGSKRLPVAVHRFIARVMDSNRTVRVAAAAVIVLAVLLVTSHLDGLPPGTGVAWGDVVTHIGDVDHVHMYYFKSRGRDFYRHFEGWHAGGKTVQHVFNGDTVYDDGHRWQRFNKAGILIQRNESAWPDGKTFLQNFSIDRWSGENPRFIERVPTRVGDDFLIYTFAPDASESKWQETISVTVGRISLLPVQVKFSDENGDYDLLILDYEAPEKPAGFFEPPAMTPANGEGELVPDGPEVMIDITGAPDLKAARVRLHSKSVDESGEVSFSLNMTFVTEDGLHSHTVDLENYRPDEAKMCGTGGIGGFEGWPDGKYRNIRFSPWLKPTETEDRYRIEIRCRILTKSD